MLHSKKIYIKRFNARTIKNSYEVKRDFFKNIKIYENNHNWYSQLLRMLDLNNIDKKSNLESLREKTNIYL